MNRFLTKLGLPVLLVLFGTANVSAHPLTETFAETFVETKELATSHRPIKQATAPTETVVEDDFTRFMRIGYAATAQFDYNTALINFRRALELRPDNPFATVAIENVEYYIERNRAAQRQREINRLEERLAEANAKKDWVCAAATVDELITYTEENSLNRQRLLGYRGELSGLLVARADLDTWSTVCTPNRPLL